MIHHWKLIHELTSGMVVNTVVYMVHGMVVGFVMHVNMHVSVDDVQDALPVCHTLDKLDTQQTAQQQVRSNIDESSATHQYQ